MSFSDDDGYKPINHGISPAQPSERAQQMLVHATVAARGEANHHEIRQLREKVEALENRIALAHSTSEVARIAFETMKDRLDAAMKRIEELENTDRVNHVSILALSKRIEELEQWRVETTGRMDELFRGRIAALHRIEALDKQVAALQSQAARESIDHMRFK